jgi:hypothetical protein
MSDGAIRDRSISPSSRARISLSSIRTQARKGSGTPTDAWCKVSLRATHADVATGLRFGRGSPVGVPPRLLLRRPNATAQLRMRAFRDVVRAAISRLRLIPVQRAPRRPVMVPAGRCPGAARERGYEPRPQAPLSLRQSAVTGDVLDRARCLRGIIFSDTKSSRMSRDRRREFTRTANRYHLVGWVSALADAHASARHIGETTRGHGAPRLCPPYTPMACCPFNMPAMLRSSSISGQ